MLYYSEITNNTYSTPDACQEEEKRVLAEQAAAKAKREKEEQELKAKKEREASERKALAAEVEDARKQMVEAQNRYKERLNDFLKQYGTYHYSTTDTKEIPTLFDFFSPFF